MTLKEKFEVIQDIESKVPQAFEMWVHYWEHQFNTDQGDAVVEVVVRVWRYHCRREYRERKTYALGNVLLGEQKKKNKDTE